MAEREAENQEEELNYNNDSVGDKVSQSGEHTDEYGRPLTAYEIMRLERIKRNQAYLAKLGLEEAKAEQEKEAQKQKASNKRDKKSPVFYEQRETLSRRSKGQISYIMPKISEFRETMASAKKQKKPKRERNDAKEERLPLFIYQELRTLQTNKRQRLANAERLVRLSEKELKLTERIAEKQERRELAKKEREEKRKLSENKKALLPYVQELDKRRNEILRSRKRLSELSLSGTSAESRKKYIDEYISQASEKFHQELKDTENNFGQLLLERVPPFHSDEFFFSESKSKRDSEQSPSKPFKLKVVDDVGEGADYTSRDTSGIVPPSNINLDECEKIATEITTKRKQRKELKSRNVGGPVTERLSSAIQRGWCDHDYPISSGCCLDYVPQVGDVVLYYPCAHYEFLKIHPDIRCKKKRLKLRRPLWEVALEEKKDQDDGSKGVKKDRDEEDIQSKRKPRDIRPWWTDEWLASISSDSGRYPVICRVEKVVAEFPYDQESETEQRRFQHEVYKASHGKPAPGKRRDLGARLKPLRHKPSLSLAVNLKPLAPISPPLRTRRNVLKGDFDDVDLSLPPLFSVLTHPSDEASQFVVPFLPAFRSLLALRSEEHAKYISNDGSRHSVRIIGVKEDDQEPFESIVRLLCDIIGRHSNIDFSSIQKLDNILTCSYGESNNEFFPQGEMRAFIQTILYQYQISISSLADSLHLHSKVDAPENISQTSEALLNDLLKLVRLTVPRWNSIKVTKEGDDTERSLCCWQLFPDEDNYNTQHDAVIAAMSPNILFSSTRTTAGSLVYSIDETLRKEIQLALEYIIETHDKVYLFCPPVTEAVAPEYFRFVPIGMCLRKILKRLQPQLMRYPRQASKSGEDSLEDQAYGESTFCYYRHVSSITSDIMDIFANCLLYNAPESDIVSDAFSISMYLKVVIEKINENRCMNVYSTALEARNVELVLNQDERSFTMTRRMRLQSAVKPHEVDDYDSICRIQLLKNWMKGAISEEFSTSKSNHDSSYQGWLPQCGDKVIYNRILHAQFVQGHSGSLKSNQRALPPVLPPKRRKKNDPKLEPENTLEESEFFQYFLGTVLWVRAVMPNDEMHLDDKTPQESPLLAIGISFHYKWLQDMTHVIYWRPCIFAPQDIVSTCCEICSLPFNNSFLCPAWTGPIQKVLPPYPLSYGRVERPDGVASRHRERITKCLCEIKNRILQSQKLTLISPNKDLVRDDIDVSDVPLRFRHIFIDTDRGNIDSQSLQAVNNETDSSVALKKLSDIFFRFSWQIEGHALEKVYDPLPLHEKIMANSHLCLETIQERLNSGFYRSLLAVSHDIREACLSIIRYIVKENIHFGIIAGASERKIISAIIQSLGVDIIEREKAQDSIATVLPYLSKQEKALVQKSIDIIELYAIASICCENTSICEVAFGLEPDDLKINETVLCEEQDVALKNSGLMMASLGKDQMKFRKPMSDSSPFPSVTVSVKSPAEVDRTVKKKVVAHISTPWNASIGPPIVLRAIAYQRNQRFMKFAKSFMKGNTLPDLNIIVKANVLEAKGVNSSSSTQYPSKGAFSFPIEFKSEEVKTMKRLTPFLKKWKISSGFTLSITSQGFNSISNKNVPKIQFTPKDYIRNVHLNKIFGSFRQSEHPSNVSVAVLLDNLDYSEIADYDSKSTEVLNQEPDGYISNLGDDNIDSEEGAVSNSDNDSIKSNLDVECVSSVKFEHANYKENPALLSALFCHTNRKDVCARCTLKKQDLITCRLREGHSNRDFIWTEYLKEIGGVDGMLLRLHPKWRPPPPVGSSEGNVLDDRNLDDAGDDQTSQSQHTIEAVLSTKAKFFSSQELHFKAEKALQLSNILLTRAKKDSEVPVMLGDEFMRSSFNVDPDDGHYEICIMCGLGGDVICCESCPMVSHPKCVNMESIPDEDWHCFRCSQKESEHNDTETEKSIINRYNLETSDGSSLEETITSLLEELKSYRHRGPSVALGAKVAKVVNDKYFEGEVTGLPSHEEDDNVYKVLFEDDDEEEEVTSEELQKYLSVYASRRQQQVLNVNENEDSDEDRNETVVQRRGRPRKYPLDDRTNFKRGLRTRSESSRSNSNQLHTQHIQRGPSRNSDPCLQSRGRGRPRKYVEVDETSRIDDEPPSKRRRYEANKKRGRPRKLDSNKSSFKHETKKASVVEQPSYTHTGRRLRTPDRFAPTAMPVPKIQRKTQNAQKNAQKHNRTMDSFDSPDIDTDDIPAPGHVDPSLTYYVTVENDTSATIARKLKCDSWLDIAYVPENMRRFPSLQNQKIKFRKGTLVRFAECTNWAQIAGPRPYESNWAQNSSIMWSPRWGHAVIVANQTDVYRTDLTDEENSRRVENLQPTLILLGGDDYNSITCNFVCAKTKELSVGGLKNDIWISTVSSKKSSFWKARKEYNPFLHRLDFDYVESTMSWEQVNPGYEAPPIWPNTHKRAGETLTFFEWIQCQDYFNDKRANDIDCNETTWREFKKRNMWTPRRGHGVVSTNGSLIVIGGRSRKNELVREFDLNGEAKRFHSSNQTNHLSSTLTNDIWISLDGSGKSWQLVTIGCQDHQEDLILHSEVWSNDNSAKEGTGPKKCIANTDCYGDAVCKMVGSSVLKTCVCPIFSMREHHSVSVQHRAFARQDGSFYSEDYIYVVGGSTSIRNSFCSSYSCGSDGSYAQSLSDIWVASSRDLTKWVQIRPSISPNGDLYKSRFGHGAVLVHSNHFRNRFVDQLWIIGGRFVSPKLPHSLDLNDVWKLSLPSLPCCVVDNTCDNYHKSLESYIDSSCLPRIHDMIVDDRKVKWEGKSGFVTIYEPPSSSNEHLDAIIIIGGKHNDEFQSDVWYLELKSDSEWERDFSEAETNKEKINTQIGDPTKVGHRFHYDEESKLSLLSRMFLPITAKMESDIYYTPSIESVFDNHELEILKSKGIVTIKDLAGATLQRILSLRGYEYPHVSPRPIENICYSRTLAEAFLSKCSTPIISPRASSVIECKIHGNEHNVYDDNCVSQRWNGCDPIQGYKYIDIHGIGIVDVPYEPHDISSDLENMHCKSTLDGRSMAAGAFVDGKPLVLGGRGSDMTLHQDVWVRDTTNPVTVIDQKPTSFSAQSKFTFKCSKDGVFQFEYKIFDTTERLDVTPWIFSTYDETVDVSWLDSKKGGPGSGWYTMYVRAVDPGGNRDESFSTSTNTYTWYYSQPLPYRMIFLCVFLGTVLSIGAYIEYRRRERRQMIESYKRRKLRRKFKLNSMSKGVLENLKSDYSDSGNSYINIRRERRKLKKQVLDSVLSSDEDDEHRENIMKQKSTHYSSSGKRRIR